MQTLLRILDKVKQLGNEYIAFTKRYLLQEQAQEDIC